MNWLTWLKLILVKGGRGGGEAQFAEMEGELVGDGVGVCDSETEEDGEGDDDTEGVLVGVGVGVGVSEGVIHDEFEDVADGVVVLVELIVVCALEEGIAEISSYTYVAVAVADAEAEADAVAEAEAVAEEV